MSYKVKCPYCQKENTIDDYEGYVYSEESFPFVCHHCDKLMMVEPHVTIHLIGQKCECQGENHEWIPSITFPKCCTEMVCKHCGETRNMTEEEKIKYKIPSVDEYLNSLSK